MYSAYMSADSSGAEDCAALAETYIWSWLTENIATRRPPNWTMRNSEIMFTSCLVSIFLSR